MISMGGTKLPPATLEQIIGRTLHVIVQAARLSDGSRRVTSITEVLGYEEVEIITREVFTYQRQGMDANGKVIGKHLYIASSYLRALSGGCCVDQRINTMFLVCLLLFNGIFRSSDVFSAPALGKRAKAYWINWADKEIKNVSLFKVEDDYLAQCHQALDGRSG